MGDIFRNAKALLILYPKLQESIEIFYETIYNKIAFLMLTPTFGGNQVSSFSSVPCLDCFFWTRL